MMEYLVRKQTLKYQVDRYRSRYVSSASCSSETKFLGSMPERDMFDDEEEEEEQEGEDQQSKSGAQNNQEEQQVGNVETVHGQMGKDSEGSQGDQDIKQPNLSIGSPSTTLPYTPAPRAAAELDMIQTTQNELDCLSATALPSVMSNNISGAEEASMAAEMAMAAADGLASLRGLIRNKDYPIERALNVSQIKVLTHNQCFFNCSKCVVRT